MMKFQEIKERVVARLTKELPDDAFYHSVSHTLYVLDRAEHIAKKEKVSAKNMRLIKVAALFHDIGFVKSSINHEKVGCGIASKELKKIGFASKDIDQVCGMIMATKIPQTPKTHLEQIVADADLEYLGTKYYGHFSELLFKEMKSRDRTFNRRKWKKLQVQFLQNHTYHTAFCQRYKEHRKANALAKLTA